MRSVVTFKPQGRLGNYLFQAFTAMAYACEHDLDFSMPRFTNDQKWNPIYFPELIHPNLGKNCVYHAIAEKTYFKYDELPFCTAWKNGWQIELHGYFQNPKYFERHANDIILKLNSVVPNQLFTARYGHTSIHVRRGDYLTIPDKHVVQTKEWIEQAISYMDGIVRPDYFQDYVYEFYSDDIQWCKDNFQGRGNFVFSEGKTELEDLLSISQCEFHINSSSTFSWMGAWLDINKNKTVITPKEWMTKTHTDKYKGIQELIPETWIKL